MITLPNGCTCSELTVNPSNWNTFKYPTPLKKTWYIQYHFYDPLYRTSKEYKYGKLVIIKGMNRLKLLSERREATKRLIENEIYQLKEKGYNSISGKFIPVMANGIEPNTPFIDALRKAYNLLKLEASTKNDIYSTIKFFEIASQKIGFDKYEIQAVKRKHLVQMLEMLPSLKKSWSAYSYNNCRGYLMMLYKKLLLLQAVESNPVNDIPKEQVPEKIKQLLSNEERKIIDEYLLEVDRDYRRFINIFFHSGGRRTELCRLKVVDVDLNKQFFKLLVKKGRKQRESLRPIKDIALEFWKEQLAESKPEDYVFSSNYKPGKFKLQPKKISEKWKKYVKEDLKIDIDFYSLKHLNLDETSSYIDAEAAAKMAGHTSTVITLKHYLVNEEQRKMDKLKKVNNSFA